MQLEISSLVLYFKKKLKMTPRTEIPDAEIKVVKKLHNDMKFLQEISKLLGRPRSIIKADTRGDPQFHQQIPKRTHNTDL